MRYPDKPTCHGETPRWAPGGVCWRDPETHDANGHGHPRPFRSCLYCGSMHPEDLVRLLDAGASLHGADWKYGWPHKFYVEGIPNPQAGERVVTSSRYGPGEAVEHTYGPAPATVGGKFYNEHLRDDGLDDEAFARVAVLLATHGGILFTRDAGGLHYRAPSHGYQRY